MTVRARWPVFGEQPTIGILFATATGRIVYRILAIDRVPAGSAYRYRFRCARLTRAEVPECIPIYPWKWDPRGPRRVAATSRQ